MFSKAFLKLYYTIIYSCTLMYMRSSVIHFAFAHVQINAEGDDFRRAKPNSVFCLVFFGDLFDLLSDCLQMSHPSFNGMNVFVCFWVCSASPSFHACVTPLGFLCRSDGSFGEADLGGCDIKAGGVRTESPGESQATSSRQFILNMENQLGKSRRRKTGIKRCKHLKVCHRS